MIAGLHLFRDFIAPERERQLLHACECGHWLPHVCGKRNQFYYRPGFMPRPHAEIPARLSWLVDQISMGDPYRLIVSQYEKGVGMPLHNDIQPGFKVVGAVVSLGSDCEWEWVSHDGECAEVLQVPARSLLIFGGSARYEYRHAVRPVPARRTSYYFSYEEGV